MSPMIINREDFLKEIMIEDVYILKWKILNSVLLKKSLYGAAIKEVEVDTVYMNFSIYGAAYSFYAHSYVLQKSYWSETGLMMGYIEYKNIQRELKNSQLENLKRCPLTGEEYVPLKKVKKVPLCNHPDYKIPYKKNQSSAYREEYANKDRKYLDEEFFFSLLNTRGFEIEDVR